MCMCIYIYMCVHTGTRTVPILGVGMVSDFDVLCNFQVKPVNGISCGCGDGTLSSGQIFNLIQHHHHPKMSPASQGSTNRMIHPKRLGAASHVKHT